MSYFQLANNNIKEIVVPVIMTTLEFFEIGRDFPRINTIIFHQLIFHK